MDSSSSTVCTPENEVLNFKQRGGENLKDAWYRICNAHNTSIRKQSTVVLLRCFYVGITTWYRFFLDTITGGNFLMCSSLDAFNAMGNLVGSSPLMVNETTLTLEHVMERLDAIEKKMLTEEHIGNFDKNMHNFATKIRSNAGEVFKLLKEKGTVIHERIGESPARIDKLEEIFSNLSMAFTSTKTIENTPIKTGKAPQVTKNKGATSSNNSKEDLKMISINPDFVEVIRDPLGNN